MDTSHRKMERSMLRSFAQYPFTEYCGCPDCPHLFSQVCERSILAYKQLDFNVNPGVLSHLFV